MADLIIPIPVGDITITLDQSEESADWMKYAVLYKKGYSEREAKEIMKRVRKGEFSNVRAVPRKMFGGGKIK